MGLIITGDYLKKLKGHGDEVRAIAFSHDGKLLASGGKDKTAIVWEVATGKELKRFKGHAEDIHAVAFSGDNKTLATGGNDNIINLWDVASGANKTTLGGHADGIRAMAAINGGKVLISADGKFFRFGDAKCSIRTWDFASGQELSAEPNDCSLTTFAFSPDERLLAMAVKNIAIMSRGKK